GFDFGRAVVDTEIHICSFVCFFRQALNLFELLKCLKNTCVMLGLDPSIFVIFQSHPANRDIRVKPEYDAIRHFRMPY
ncbi:MAG: hypothetical protein Q4C79_11700, partial [Neisseria sp.]|uniref:hypothetical protein n=1 Tax=Neisseria sp. TaxID=192066 RepID=UPI0026DC36C1